MTDGEARPPAPAPAPPPIENLAAATFKCVFPACGGICCRDGRPPVEPDEQARIEGHLPALLPLLRPSARAHVERHGWLTNRVKAGCRTIAVEGGWCVFENGGCTLQRAGASEGEPWRFKPSVCVRFPIEQSARDGAWYVRQWGHRGEAWDLFCLNPEETTTPAAESLRDEVAFVAEREAKAPAGGAGLRLADQKRDSGSESASPAEGAADAGGSGYR
jgi:hypothetical protein